MNSPLRLLELARPFRSRLVLTALLMLASAMAGLALPYLAGKLMSAVQSGPLPGQLLLLILLFIVVQLLLALGGRFLMWHTADRVTVDVQRKLFRHLHGLPLNWFNQKKPGDVISLLSLDVQTLSSFLSATVPTVLPTLATLLGALTLMAFLDLRAALAAGVAIPVFYLITKLWTRRVRTLARGSMDAHAQAIAIAEESLSLIPVVKAFQRETLESERFDARLAEMLQARDALRRVVTPVGTAIQMMAMGGVIGLVWLTAGGTEAPDLATLVTLVFYGFLVAGPVANLANVYGSLQQVNGALARLNDAWCEPAELGGNEILPAGPGALRFESVDFDYPDGTQVLRGFDQSIAAGSCVALVGPNGSGKTTLTRLLLGFNRPTSGRVLIDGFDIARADIQDLRRHIALVPQSVMLLDASVRDNIAFGCTSASEDDIARAAAAAGAEEFIRQLPDGIATRIGPRGVRLSGGQQQRIALARALIRDASILILDEATAMFDPEGEAEFVAAARECFKGKTVLFITHRPAVLALADQTIEMPTGRIA